MKTEYRLDYETILSGKAEVVHLALVFDAEIQPSLRKTPISFGLVMDNSGSMEGEPLEYAKLAAAMVVRNLREDDYFSLVVFSSTARTVIPLQPAKNKAGMITRIDAIREDGSTNLTAGWMLGRDELTKTPAEIPRKILLLTDGHLNAGISDPNQIRQIIENGMEKNAVRTACLGFGDGYNEDMLDQISKAGAGALHDAASPENFPAIFQKELESLLSLSTQNLRVRVHKLLYCNRLALLSDYPMVSLPEGGIEISVGDLVSHERRVLILALEVLPIPAFDNGQPAASIEGEALLEIELAYDEITDTGIVSKTEKRTIRLVAVQDPADVRVDAQTVQWVAAQEAGKAISDAIGLLDKGDHTAVNQRINAIKSRLKGYNCDPATDHAMQVLEQFEASSEQMDARSRKAHRSYSNRAMKTSSHYEADPTQPPSPPTEPSK